MSLRTFFKVIFFFWGGGGQLKFCVLPYENPRPPSAPTGKILATPLLCATCPIWAESFLFWPMDYINLYACTNIHPVPRRFHEKYQLVRTVTVMGERLILSPPTNPHRVYVGWNEIFLIILLNLIIPQKHVKLNLIILEKSFIKGNRRFKNNFDCTLNVKY